MILDDLMLSNVSSITGMAQGYAIILTNQRKIPKTIKQKCATFGFFGLGFGTIQIVRCKGSFFVGFCEKNSHG